MDGTIVGRCQPGWRNMDRVRSAKDVLQEKRHQSEPNWSRLLLRPIRLRDGTVLFTLKDAARKVLEMPASPSSRVAAERIIAAATGEGDMSATQVSVRLALLKDVDKRP
jgi:hypothetical protein